MNCRGRTRVVERRIVKYIVVYFIRFPRGERVSRDFLNPVFEEEDNEIEADYMEEDENEDEENLSGIEASLEDLADIIIINPVPK